MSGANIFLRVFVYGTLKVGEPNHGWLTKVENGHARFLGNGKTAMKYPLVIGSKYNIPFLLDVPGTGNQVLGEVYEIDEKMLSNLDILEGYPEFYTRREEQIEMDQQQTQQCWVYLLSSNKPHLLKLPFLTSYSSSGDHGLPYVERYLRDPNWSIESDE